MESELLEGLAELLWPTRCVICDRPGTLLCDNCREELPWIDRQQACPLCGVPYGQYLCVDCGRRELAGQEPFSFSQARSALELTPASRRLVTCFKDGGERRLAALLANILFHAVPRCWWSWVDILTYIPADRAALRKRDFDHMALIAGQIQPLAGAGIDLQPLLVKGGSSDQRALDREQRRENMQGTFSLRSQAGELVQGARILLLDDVMTSGATLDTASGVLLAAGAAEIRVATILRAW